MKQEAIPLQKTAQRFIKAVKSFAMSDVGWKARAIFAAFVVLLCGVNGLNVVNSFVGRNFMTAITDRNYAEFVRQALFYFCVFGGSTLVAVVARYSEERLALLWRDFVTRRGINFYLTEGMYHRLDVSGELANPDQRIAEDVRAFTVSTLSFVLMAFNSSFTIVAFSGVLWSISPLLFGVAALYAALGSCLTIVLGRPLVRLNYNQFDREASFRSALIHIRENAEAIMLARREEFQKSRLGRLLDDLVVNFRAITQINRNVGFFTTGYSWLIQIIPALIIAPAYIRGEIEFGVVTQSAMAFSTLVGAFSLVVTQFQSLSTFAAVVSRLNSLIEIIDPSQTAARAPIAIEKVNDLLAFEELTLHSSRGGDLLLKDLTLSIPYGTHVLFTGPNQAARALLFKVTAGIAVTGRGRILRPAADEILFLSQRPYLLPGTPRQAITRPSRRTGDAEEHINVLLRELGLHQALNRVGGLDTSEDWATLLSLREQYLLAVTDIVLAAPRFAFLDRIDAVLAAEDVGKILNLLKERGITYVVSADSKTDNHYYDAVIECEVDGNWRIMSICT